MSIWKDFEIQCTEYLNNKFGAYATFIHQGGSNSTIPDILVNTNSGNTFYIDAKHSPAQCGQFVLLPNLETRTFEYSHQNATPFNPYTEIIIAFMNENFNEFKDAGTSGKDINIPNNSNIFGNWIIQTYKNKGVKFFITNGYTILPIDSFLDYFNVTAKYRIKRSGSSSVGKSRLESVKNYIFSHDYIITNSHFVGNKLFVVSPQQLHEQRFLLRGIEYMFSLRENEYELRRLSNTYNANVIFSIKYKSTIPGMTDNDFIYCLM